MPAEYYREWNRRNKDRVNESKRKRYRINHENALERRRAYYSLNKEKINAKSREHYRQNKELHKVRQRKYGLKRKYGITHDEYLLLLESQGGRCAMCQTDEPRGQYNTFHIDHCHETGKIRGLLCHACNTGLGLIGDNVENLERAIEYLKNSTPS